MENKLSGDKNIGESHAGIKRRVIGSGKAKKKYYLRNCGRLKHNMGMVLYMSFTNN